MHNLLLIAALMIPSYSKASEIVSHQSRQFDEKTGEYLGCLKDGTLDGSIAIPDCYSRIKKGRYFSCQEKAVDCRKIAKTCAQHDSCQFSLAKTLGGLVLNSLKELDGDLLQICQERRQEAEDSYWAHSTTIECMDTKDGPKFGG